MEKKWTVADMISSYRFWGLIFYAILTSAALAVFITFTPAFLRQVGFSIAIISASVSTLQFCLLPGFLLAWGASRIKNCYVLYLVTLVISLGLASFCLGLENEKFLLLGYLLIGLGQGCFTILLPTYLAGAIGVTEAFVIVFGLYSLLTMAAKIVATPLAGYFYNYIASDGPLIAIPFFVSVILALLFFLPVKKKLFFESPAPRYSTKRAPAHVDPPAVFLLFSFIPFYSIYWFFRIHRETHSLISTPQLMTARGAAWCAALVPFGWLILFVMLNDILREVLERKGLHPGYKTRWIMLLGIVYPPFSAAMIQAQMNRIAEQSNAPGVIHNDLPAQELPSGVQPII